MHGGIDETMECRGKWMNMGMEGRWMDRRRVHPPFVGDEQASAHPQPGPLAPKPGPCSCFQALTAGEGFEKAAIEGYAGREVLGREKATHIPTPCTCTNTHIHQLRTHGASHIAIHTQ